MVKKRGGKMYKGANKSNVFIPPNSHLIQQNQQGTNSRMPLGERSFRERSPRLFSSTPQQTFQQLSTSNSNLNPNYNTTQNSGEYSHKKPVDLRSTNNESWSHESKQSTKSSRTFTNCSEKSSSFRGNDNHSTRGFRNDYKTRSRDRGSSSHSSSRDHRPYYRSKSKSSQHSQPSRNFTPITQSDIDRTHELSPPLPDSLVIENSPFNSILSSNNPSTSQPKLTPLKEISDISGVSSHNSSNPIQQRVAPLGIGSQSATLNQPDQPVSSIRNKQNLTLRNEKVAERPVYNELLRPTSTSRNNNFNSNTNININTGNNIDDGLNIIQEEWRIPSDVSIVNFLGIFDSYLKSIEYHNNVRTWRYRTFEKSDTIHILGTIDNVNQAKKALENRLYFINNDQETEPCEIFPTDSRIPKSPPKPENRVSKEERKLYRAETIKELKRPPVYVNKFNSYFILLDDKLSVIVFGENLNSLDDIIFTNRVNIWFDKEMAQLRISANTKEQHEIAHDQVSKIYENHFYLPIDPLPYYLLYIPSDLDVKLETPHKDWMISSFVNMGTVATTNTPLYPTTPDLYDYSDLNHKFTAEKTKNALTNLKETHSKVKLRLFFGKIVYNRGSPYELRPRQARERLENHSESKFGHFHRNLSPLVSNLGSLLDKCDKIFIKKPVPRDIEYTFKVCDADQSVYKFHCTFDYNGEPSFSKYYYADKFPAVIYHSTPNSPLDYSTDIQVNRIISHPSKHLEKFASTISKNTTNELIHYTNNLAICMNQVIKKQKYYYTKNNYSIVVTNYEIYKIRPQTITYKTQYISQEKTVPIIPSESGQSIALIRDNWDVLKASHSLESGEVADWSIDELFDKTISRENYEFCTESSELLFNQANT